MAEVLDACCGSRMFWFDKEDPRALFMDNRTVENELLCDNRRLTVNPDVLADFTDMPFDDESFSLVVFDPPHLLRAGPNSWLAKKYGKLNESWPTMLHDGFDECMRVLKPSGTLIFKWNEDQIKLKDVLATTEYKPLFGNKRSKTHWVVFIK
ncbi:SAM-dependent methyltransferase [Companilactobacillus sp.]|uniref:SAM-dependent methyltransferase n=1 Tax=Companilactobacillus sp. TaxID=2767905 RepID=UPI0026282DBB|nr:SAM-dependent methyltransferase [Companilactobacillus sp.]